MKKLYIYKGLGQTDQEYQWLIDKIANLYDIEFKYYDLLKDSFEHLIQKKLAEDSLVFGFSLGALIAYKLETKMSLGIYASPTPILDNSNIDKKELIEENIGKENWDYIKRLKYSKPNAKESFILYGDKEQWADIAKFNPQYIKNSGHQLTSNYRKRIVEILTKVDLQ